MLFCSLSLTAGSLPAATPGQAPTPPRIHPVTGAKLNAFGPGLDLDTETKRIYIEGKVALDSGILEFLLVQGAKKGYEAALTTQARPSQTMAAMLLLGWQPGDAVSLTLLAGKDTLPLERLIRNRDTTVKAASALRWKLVGSNYLETRSGKAPFAADAEGILIALVDRSEAVVELQGKLTNPYHNAYFGYAINRGAARAPKAGSPVTLILAKESP